MFKKNKNLSKHPVEALPEIGTVQNPALYYDGEDVYLSYQVSPRGGDGCAILRFTDVIEVLKTSINVRELTKHEYPCSPWDFNEIAGSQKMERWKILEPRFWIISFNDVSVEILFKTVEITGRIQNNDNPDTALKDFIKQL